MPDLVSAVKAHVPHSSTVGGGTSSSAGTTTTSGGSNTTGETLLSQAQRLANQASQYAQQGVHQLAEKLPENITSHLPDQIKNVGNGNSNATSGQQLEEAATGEKAYDFTEAHTTGNFEASGEAHISHSSKYIYIYICIYIPYAANG